MRARYGSRIGEHDAADPTDASRRPDLGHGDREGRLLYALARVEFPWAPDPDRYLPDRRRDRRAQRGRPPDSRLRCLLGGTRPRRAREYRSQAPVAAQGGRPQAPRECGRGDARDQGHRTLPRGKGHEPDRTEAIPELRVPADRDQTRLLLEADRGRDRDAPRPRLRCDPAPRRPGATAP